MRCALLFDRLVAFELDLSDLPAVLALLGMSGESAGLAHTVWPGIPETVRVDLGMSAADVMLEAEEFLRATEDFNMGDREMGFDRGAGDVAVALVTRLAERRWGREIVACYSDEGAFLYAQRVRGEGRADGHVGYQGAINNLSVVDATKLDWSQVLEFREDVGAARKYRDLRIWLRSGLEAESVEEATDVIGQKIEDYEWAIRKHGLKSTVGGISQMFGWKDAAVAAAAGFGVGAVWGALVAGSLLVGKASVWLAERRMEYETVRRGDNREIAIIYEACKKFGVSE